MSMKRELPIEFVVRSCSMAVLTISGWVILHGRDSDYAAGFATAMAVSLILYIGVGVWGLSGHLDSPLTRRVIGRLDERDAAIALRVWAVTGKVAILMMAMPSVALQFGLSQSTVTLVMLWTVLLSQLFARRSYSNRL